MSPEARNQGSQEFSVNSIRASIYRSIGLEGKEILRELSSTYALKERSFSSKSAEFAAMPIEKKILYRNSLAKVFFSCTTKAIDVLLLEGLFNPRNFYSWYRLLTSDTSLPEPQPEPEDLIPVKLDSTNLEELRNVAKTDETYASLFSNKGILLLPPALRGILLKSGMLQTIRNEVIPEYKGRLAEQGIGRSHKAIAIKRHEEVVRQDGNQFEQLSGDSTLRKYTGEKPKKTDSEETQSYPIYEPLLPYFEQLLIDHEKAERERYRKGDDNKKALASKYYGDLPPDTKIAMHPSIAAQCFRKVGYYYLGVVEPEPSSIEGILAKHIGTGFHNQMRIVSYTMDRKYLISEMALPIFPRQEDEFRGKMDLLHRNPVTKVTDIIDHKTVHPFVFRKITKAGLPSYLSGTPFYTPSRENAIQLATYIWLLDKDFPWLNIQSGRVFEYDVESKARKEGIIPWDAVAKWRFEQFLEIKRGAEEKILQGELPEEPEELPSESYQCQRCEFLAKCPPGQRIAAEKIEKRVKPRAPASVYAIARKERRERSLALAKLGVKQEGFTPPELAPLETRF